MPIVSVLEFPPSNSKFLLEQSMLPVKVLVLEQ